MIKIDFKVAVLAFGCMLFAQPALANLRCGTHVLQTGARDGPGMYEVLMKCGTPTERLGTKWIYKRYGSTQIVYFNDSGRLSRVEVRSGQ
jgi:hypothetical protein